MTQTVVNVPAAGAFDPTDITLTDDTSGALLIKEGSNEYMRIDTTNGSALTEFNVPANDGAGFTINLPADGGSNTGFQLLVPSSAGHLKFGRQASGIYSGGTGFDLNVGAGKSFIFNGAQVMMRTSSTPIEFNLDASGGSVKITDAGDAEIFKVEEDSNATFTLDDGSGATFTIKDDASPTPALHLRCTESASTAPSIEVNGLVAFPTRKLTLSSITYGTAFYGSANQARLSVSLGATSATRNVNIGAVNMDNFAQILTATPSTTGQTFTLDFNNTSTSLSGLPISLYKLVLKNAGTESCTFTAASTMASGGRVKGVDISGASIGVIDSSSGSITAAAGETIYVEVTNHVSDSAGGLSNRFIICKTICKI